VFSAALSVGTALAQQQAAGATTAARPEPRVTVADSLHFDSPQTQVRLEDLQAPQPDKVKLKKHFVLGGPLVHAFNVKKVTEVPKHLFHLVNPFAKTDSGEESHHVVDGLDTRSWSTIAGWHPGASAWDDPVTHEAQGLFSTSW
jgi:hypothetical protein